MTGTFVEGADMTDRSLAESLLRDLDMTPERRVTAEILGRGEPADALRQAQKMEAMGRLTVGIVHDFNNMLQVVTGGIDLARRRVASGKTQDALEFLDDARDAATRAGALTQRLLAFARRQAVDLKPVVLADLIRGLSVLIQRTVGTGVRIELRLQDRCWPVRCDLNQMENALLNLAMNGRDAMRSHGGVLRIETAHVILGETETSGWNGAKAGEYVRVTVSDIGNGMPPEVMARAFEPFYTTKAPEEGTGLGLSQLFDFVQQSCGIVRLQSKLGAGTSVHLYLPRCRDVLASSERSLASEARPHPTQIARRATVLLVEDEASIRQFASEALQELGYRVLEAEDGSEALELLRLAMLGPEAGMVDLLVTDVGLPRGMSGRQLAAAARIMVADLPVLLITGYEDDALEENGHLGMELLGKPFDLEVLAWRVQKLIKWPGLSLHSTAP